MLDHYESNLPVLLFEMPLRSIIEYYRFDFLNRLDRYEKFGCRNIDSYGVTKGWLCSSLNRYYLHVSERKYFKYREYLENFHDWKKSYHYGVGI